MPELFAKSNLMGTFKGFNEKGLEFTAEIITPYDATMLERPQLGQFILIELGDVQEASLGRITKFVPSGLLATAEGEDYINTMQRRDQVIPDDLKKDKLKYRVEIKLLGALRVAKDDNGIEKIIFVPSQRRLPHLGANVALPSNDVLKVLCSLSEGETDLGDYALGEFIYSGDTQKSASMFRHLSPKLRVNFNINNLVSKRTVVFARAGYGKSNLIKYLIAELYKGGGKDAVTEKGAKIGTLIFDADGEYFWPDHKNRPGLCDVPHLRSQIVVFTNRIGKSPYYTNWKAGEVKLDIRDLPARDVIGIAISRDRQDNQNVIKLRSLSEDKWMALVDLISRDGLGAKDDDVANLLGYEQGAVNVLAEIGAAKSNMFNVVNHLHDPQSKLISGTLTALKQGLIVVVDISLLSSKAGTNIAGLLMRKIFNYNQENFTGGSSPIPVNVVIEEAHSVLGRSLDESSPFVEWVKEGRKYDLGAVLITQQPGSMASEILSQADNWFAFHLLSEGDAETLGKYNSHYSRDVLAHLIAEPIPGNCYMWSAPKQPFVLPVRIRSFEELYQEEVVDDKNAEPVEESPAIGIRKQTSESILVLVEALKNRILQERNKLSSEEFEGNLVGIYDGQLYVFIKQIKEAQQGQVVEETENALKPVLMKALFDCDIVKRKGSKGDYHCVPRYNWEKILGTESE
jgi:hypothetical protein